MKKSKFLSYILIFALISAILMPSSASALSEPETSAKEVVLLDTATGDVLYSKDADEQAYPASTTKIMTVLLAVEAIEDGKVALSDSVTAGSDILDNLTEDSSTAGIVPGETMTLENLLYCAMLSSANEACNIIAEYIGGDISTFVEMMNEKAEELGCTGTHFTNPHGLPDYQHYTTASDLSKIALEAYSHPLFMEICNTATKTIPATNKSNERYLSNTNGLINNDSELYPGYFYEYARGIKTGHTNDAGYCLVSSATKGDVSLLCVILGDTAVKKVEGIDYMNFIDSVTVYNWAFENYSYRDIIKTTDMIQDIPVKMGKDADCVTVRPEKAISALMASDEDNSSFDTKVTIYNEDNGTELTAPVEAGTVLGEISLSRGGVVYGTSKLVACSTVDVSYSQLIKSKIAKTFRNPLVIVFLLVILGLLAVYIILVIRYRKSKREYMREMKLRRMEKEKALADRQAARAAQSHQRQPYDHGQSARSSATDEPNAEKGTGVPAETQAERDYFDQFFGRNKK